MTETKTSGYSDQVLQNMKSVFSPTAVISKNEESAVSCTPSASASTLVNEVELTSETGIKNATDVGKHDQIILEDKPAFHHDTMKRNDDDDEVSARTCAFIRGSKNEVERTSVPDPESCSKNNMGDVGFVSQKTENVSGLTTTIDSTEANQYPTRPVVHDEAIVNSDESKNFKKLRMDSDHITAELKPMLAVRFRENIRAGLVPSDPSNPFKKFSKSGDETVIGRKSYSLAVKAEVIGEVEKDPDFPSKETTLMEEILFGDPDRARTINYGGDDGGFQFIVANVEVSLGGRGTSNSCRLRDMEGGWICKKGRYLLPNEEEWHSFGPGLNLEGECTNPDCVSFRDPNHKPILRMGYLQTRINYPALCRACNQRTLTPGNLLLSHGRSLITYRRTNMDVVCKTLLNHCRDFPFYWASTDGNDVVDYDVVEIKTVKPQQSPYICDWCQIAIQTKANEVRAPCGHVFHLDKKRCWTTKSCRLCNGTAH